MPRRGEPFAAVALGALVALGLALDAIVGEVSAPITRPVAGRRFEERAVFCPSWPRDPRPDAQLAIASPVGDRAAVGIKPLVPRQVDLGADRILLRRVRGRVGVDVVGYGAPVEASASGDFGPRVGAGSGNCSPNAATEWFLPEGSSGLGFDERILVYNPFPDEAVVRVTLITKTGEKVKANLGEIGVSSRGATTIKMNEFVFHQRFLATRVVAVRGRVVVWRLLFADPKRRARGTQFTLASARPATTWFFPEGATGDGYEEQISLLNPSDEEALVTISLATGEGLIQPPKLVDIAVAPSTSKAIVLPDAIQGLPSDVGGISAVVRSTNGVPIVAERTVWYAAGGLSGVASEVGASGAAHRWVVGPAAASPTTDVVVVLNTGLSKATVDLALIGSSGEPLVPDELQGLEIPSGARLKIPVGAWSDGAAMVALVESDQPVVAERFSYSAAVDDVASLMGRPIRPAEP